MDFCLVKFGIEHPMRPSRGYISSGIGMHSLMNYMLPDALIRFFKYRDTGKLQDMLNRILIDYPVDTILTMMNPTSTHDMSRLIEILLVMCLICMVNGHGI